MAQLSDTRIRNAKPKDKSYKIFDERGLYLIIDTTGRRHWRLRYEPLKASPRTMHRPVNG